MKVVSITKILNLNKNYVVATSDYLLNGGDKMNFFKLNKNVLSINYKIRDALIDYLSKNDTIAPVSDNRFIYLNIKMKRRTFIKQSSALIATSTITPLTLELITLRELELPFYTLMMFIVI